MLADPRGQIADEVDVNDVVDVRVIRMTAVLDRTKIVGRANDFFGEEKTRRELTVFARRPHDHREWLSVQADLERFLRRREIFPSAIGGSANASNLDAPERGERLRHGSAPSAREAEIAAANKRGARQPHRSSTRRVPAPTPRAARAKGSHRMPAPAAVSMISTRPSAATSADRIVVRDGLDAPKNASYSRSTSGRYFKSVT